MRGKMKNGLMLYVIATMLFAAFVIQPGFAQMTTLSAPGIADTTKTPGSSLSVEITVADVENLWGFQFILSYDTSVLTATGYTNFPIFYLEEPGEINDSEGYVSIAFHMAYGVPAGYTGTTWIAKIDFTVDDYGASQLDIHDSILSDPLGAPIGHIEADGYFLNVAGVPVASFGWSPETPIERETVTFTSTSIDPDGYIAAWDWDFGDGSTGSGAETTHGYRTAGTYTVTLTVTDDEGKVDSFFDVVEVLPPPIARGVDLHESKAAHRRFDVSVRDPETINTFTAMVKSENPAEDTLVRVVWSVWEFPAMEAMGSIETEALIAPKELAKFTADFDVFDARWKFDGTGRMDYEVRTEVFWLTPDGWWQKGTVNSENGSEWFSVTTLP